MALGLLPASETTPPEPATYRLDELRIDELLADALIARRNRADVERTIDLLIALLDTRDAPDEDLEDDDSAEHCGDDEPSLAAPENYSDQRHWAQGGDLFCVDLESDLSDLEPSLGATEFICQSIAWGAAETPWGPDVEDVNEGGRDDFRIHERWFTRQVEPTGGAHV